MCDLLNTDTNTEVLFLFAPAQVLVLLFGPNTDVFIRKGSHRCGRSIVDDPLPVCSSPARFTSAPLHVDCLTLSGFMCRSRTQMDGFALFLSSPSVQHFLPYKLLSELWQLIPFSPQPLCCHGHTSVFVGQSRCAGSRVCDGLFVLDQSLNGESGTKDQLPNNWHYN